MNIIDDTPTTNNNSNTTTNNNNDKLYVVSCSILISTLNSN